MKRKAKIILIFTLLCIALLYTGHLLQTGQGLGLILLLFWAVTAISFTLNL
jgi:hypothetical protein